MKLVRRLGWLLVLLLAWFAAFVVTGMALSEGAGWSFGWLVAVWGVFLLAEIRRWIPLRDLAWAASVGCGFGIIRWLDPLADGAPGVWRWLLAAADLLCLAVFLLIAPALLSKLGRHWRAPDEADLPVEKPAAQLRQWGPRDES